MSLQHPAPISLPFFAVCTGPFRPYPIALNYPGHNRRYGSDGIACGTCAPGQGLNRVRTRCLHCDVDKYSPDGVACLECNLGFEVNDDQTGCDACGWGTYSRDGVSCEVCRPGQEPAYEAFEAEAPGCRPCVTDDFSRDGVVRTRPGVAHLPRCDSNGS